MLFGQFLNIKIIDEFFESPNCHFSRDIFRACDEGIIDKYQIDLSLFGEGIFQPIKECLIPIITQERRYFRTLRDISLRIDFNQRNPTQLETITQLFDDISCLPKLRSLDFHMQPPLPFGEDENENEKMFSVFSRFNKEEARNVFPVLEYLAQTAKGMIRWAYIKYHLSYAYQSLHRRTFPHIDFCSLRPIYGLSMALTTPTLLFTRFGLALLFSSRSSAALPLSDLSNCKVSTSELF